MKVFANYDRCEIFMDQDEISIFKGIWEHPEIDNPNYKYDPEIGIYEDWGAIGFDLWQVKAGSIFDNIVITDNPIEAKVGISLSLALVGSDLSKWEIPFALEYFYERFRPLVH